MGNVSFGNDSPSRGHGRGNKQFLRGARGGGRLGRVGNRGPGLLILCSVYSKMENLFVQLICN